MLTTSKYHTEAGTGGDDFFNFWMASGGSRTSQTGDANLLFSHFFPKLHAENWAGIDRPYAPTLNPLIP